MGKAIAGSKRIDALSWDPDAPFIVGLDARPDGSVDGKEHPRWDPRVALPVDEALVLSIMEHGKNLQPITLVEVDGVGEVDDGRQRVRAAREAKRRLAKAGSSKSVLIISTLGLRGYSDVEHATISMELNGLRQDDDMMTKAERAAHALRFADTKGQATSRSAVARANRWNLGQLDNALLVVERGSADVKRGLREGRLSLSLAAEIACKPKAEQGEAMEKVADVASQMPEGRRVTRAQATRGAGVAIELRPSKRTVGRLLEATESVDGSFAVDDVPDGVLLGALWALGMEIPGGLHDGAAIKALNNLLKKANKS